MKILEQIENKIKIELQAKREKKRLEKMAKDTEANKDVTDNDNDDS